MNRIRTILSVSLVLILVFSLSAFAQRANTEPRVSPNASVTQTVGTTVITIEYGRPGVKGRKIWGELVPFGSIWRGGANEATTINFSKSVSINEQKIPAGQYSLFFIPSESSMTIMLNGVAKQWGAYKYDKTKDVLRLEVKPVDSGHQEWLAYSFKDVTEKSVEINLMWELVRIPFTVQTVE